MRNAILPLRAILVILTLSSGVDAKASNVELSFSSYVGGDQIDWVFDIIYDQNGDIYFTGLTGSREFLTAEPDSCPGAACYSAYLAKVNGVTYELEFVKKYGGTGSELRSFLTIDDSGYIYLAGTTESIDIPTLDGAQLDFAGGITDGYVMKVTPDDGTVIWASYIGGSGDDFLLDISIDPGAGMVYVCGGTGSTDFPTINGIQSTLNGPSDAFITAFSPDGTTLEFSSYYGGSSEDTARSISHSAFGSIVVAGVTCSADLSTTFTYGPTDKTSPDCFSLLLDATTYTQLNSARFGGPEEDRFFSSAVDKLGRICLGGIARSDGFPTVNAFQAFHAGNGDMYVTLLTPDLSTVIYGGYFGGSEIEVARDISLDTNGFVYITGEEISPDIPLNFPYQDQRIGSGDAVAVKLNLVAPTLSYSTYCGGWYYQGVLGGDVREDGLFCIGGTSKSTDYPQVNSFQPNLAGGIFDGFISCFSPPAPGAENCCRIPGDVSHDGSVTIGDVTSLIPYIFAGGSAPICYQEGDADGSGAITISDATYLIARIFSGGPPPICGQGG